MNNKTNLFEEYVNFVDSTKKQNKYFKKNFNLICGYFMFDFIFCFI